MQQINDSVKLKMSRLIHPFSAIIAGASQSGKTELSYRLIENAASMIEPPPQKIIYCYSEFQQKMLNYPGVEFHQGLPDIEMLEAGEPKLLFLDDFFRRDQSICGRHFHKV
jgi:hypothetical protein